MGTTYKHPFFTRNKINEDLKCNTLDCYCDKEHIIG